MISTDEGRGKGKNLKAEGEKCRARSPNAPFIGIKFLHSRQRRIMISYLDIGYSRKIPGMSGKKLKQKERRLLWQEY